MKEQYEVSLECVFCGSTEFEIPYEGYQPEEGEMIKCGNCGELNDARSIRDLAVNNKLEDVKKDATKYVEDELKKMFKKSGWDVK